MQTLLYLRKVHEFLPVFAELQLVLYHSRALESMTILFSLAVTKGHPFLQSLDSNMLNSLMPQCSASLSQPFTLCCWKHSTLGTLLPSLPPPLPSNATAARDVTSPPGYSSVQACVNYHIVTISKQKPLRGDNFYITKAVRVTPTVNSCTVGLCWDSSWWKFS